jgi:hypothetical protein
MNDWERIEIIENEKCTVWITQNFGSRAHNYDSSELKRKLRINSKLLSHLPSSRSTWPPKLTLTVPIRGGTVNQESRIKNGDGQLTMERLAIAACKTKWRMNSHRTNGTRDRFIHLHYVSEPRMLSVCCPSWNRLQRYLAWINFKFAQSHWIRSIFLNSAKPAVGFHLIQISRSGPTEWISIFWSFSSVP